MTSSCVIHNQCLWADLQVGYSDPDDSPDASIYPRLEIQIHVARKPGHFVRAAMAPAFLLASGAWAAWGIPSAQLGARLNVTLLMMLIAAAQRLAVVQESSSCSTSGFMTHNARVHPLYIATDWHEARHQRSWGARLNVTLLTMLIAAAQSLAVVQASR